MFGESLIKGNKDWSFDGEKIVGREECRCGKGEKIYVERTYSNDKVLKPDEVFSDSYWNCPICVEVDKEYEKICVEIDGKYAEQKRICVESLNESIVKMKKSFLDTEIDRFKIRSKKQLFELLSKSKCNQYGTIGTFYKHNSDHSVHEILLKELNGRQNTKLILGLYKFTQTPMPEDIKKLFEIVKKVNESLEKLENEISDLKNKKLSEIRNNLEK